MAHIFASYSINMDGLNLNRLSVGAYWSGFFDNQDYVYNGTIYQDVFEVDWELNGNYFASIFAGTHINANDIQIFGGTVNGYLELVWNGNQWVESWGIEGISASALDIYNAGLSPSTVDDYAFIRSQLTGDDRIDLSNYSDSAFGFDGNDSLYGRGGHDNLSGDQGKDRLWGGSGNDHLDGGSGKDRLIGGNGSDQLDGGSGNDQLLGGGGNDTLQGGSGKDRLLGGGGRDELNGGGGDDFLSGDRGDDLFIFNRRSGHDTITDFNATDNGERIDLSDVRSIRNFRDLTNHHMLQDGDDVVISAGSQNSITLLNVDLADLGSGDFIF